MGNWEHVPWVIGGEGVKHSAGVARLLAYVGFGGQEGIIGTMDLEVRQRSAGPAASVRVAPGACSIVNRATGSQYEGYAARLPIEDIVNIAATTGAARTDLIIARVKNPFLAGEPWTDPTPGEIAADTVEYIDSFAMVGMAGPTAGQHPTLAQIKSAMVGLSAIPLASIARPSATATVATSHIKDWRTIAQFRTAATVRVVNPAGTVTMSDATWRDLASATIEIPDWATHFDATAILGGVAIPAGNAQGSLRVDLDGLLTQTTNFNESPANADKATMMVGGASVAIPVANRGKSVVLKVQGSKTGGTVNASVGINASARLEAVFSAKPETNP